MHRNAQAKVPARREQMSKRCEQMSEQMSKLMSECSNTLRVDFMHFLPIVERRRQLAAFADGNRLKSIFRSMPPQKRSSFISLVFDLVDMIRDRYRCTYQFRNCVSLYLVIVYHRRAIDHQLFSSLCTMGRTTKKSTRRVPE